MMTGLATSLTRIPAAALGAAVSLLPSRRWDWFERLPVRAMVGVSAFATAALGGFVWVRGVYAYVHRAADMSAAATLDLAARQLSGAAPPGPLLMSGPQMYTIAALVGFTFFTPAGLLAVYLVLSAVLRGVAVAADDPMGDPALTSLDALGGSLLARARSTRARRARERAEGPDVGDRRYSGADAGLPGVDFVIVASRRKPDWSAATIVIAGDEWYRVAAPFDTRSSFGVRTAYPLTRIGKTEVLRKAVRYDLPPLLRGPGGLSSGQGATGQAPK
jgi:hypothetical protein